MDVTTKHRLTVTLVAFLPVMSLADEATRVLHFPADQYMGQLSVEDPCLGSEFAELDRDLSYPFGFDPMRVCLAGDWDFVGLARGDTVVPANRNLLLVVVWGVEKSEASRLSAHARYFLSNRVTHDPVDLSGLSELPPNSLYQLHVSSVVRRKDVDRRILEPLSRLTGLRVLHFTQTGVTDRQLHHLTALQSLRALSLAGEWSIRNEGLAVLRDLPALEFLDLDTSTTDKGLKHLGQLQSLRWLRLRTGRFWGPGLRELEKSPRLERLCLWGTTGITDRLVSYLEGLTHLKSLTLWGGACDSLTDAALASIGKLTSLEELYFIRTMPQFTGAGIAHLKSLRNLRRVNFAQAMVSDEGVHHLADLPRLESIGGGLHVTAEGMKTLGSMRRLTCLNVGLKQPLRGDHGPTGVSHLPHLTSLEELAIDGQLTDEDLRHIEALPGLRRLRTQGKAITDRGMVSIAKLKDLESLSLSGMHITKRGLNQLRDLTRLQTLDVRARSSTGSMIDETPLALSSLKRLKTLDLFGMALQDGDLASLAGLSDLELLRFQGTFTEAGLKYLVGLPKVKSLDIRGISCPTGAGLTHLQALEGLGDLKLRGWITDEALRQMPVLPGVWSFEAETDQTISADTASWLREHLPALEYLYIREPMRFDTPPVQVKGTRGRATQRSSGRRR